VNPAGQSDNYPFKLSEAATTNHGVHHPDLVAESGDGSMKLDDVNGWQFLLDECQNPTQAGNSRDTSSLPRQGPSSSYLKAMSLSSTEHGLARIAVDNWPVDYTPPRSFTADSYGQPRRFNERYEWFSNVNIGVVAGVVRHGGGSGLRRGAVGPGLRRRDPGRVRSGRG